MDHYSLPYTPLLAASIHSREPSRNDALLPVVCLVFASSRCVIYVSITTLFDLTARPGDEQCRLSSCLIVVIVHHDTIWQNEPHPLCPAITKENRFWLVPPSRLVPFFLRIDCRVSERDGLVTQWPPPSYLVWHQFRLSSLCVVPSAYSRIDKPWPPVTSPAKAAMLFTPLEWRRDPVFLYCGHTPSRWILFSA